MRLKLYQFLVNRIPVIQKRYHEIRQNSNGFGGRLYAWVYLIGMNIKCIFFRRKYEEQFYNPDMEKEIPEKVSESALSLRETPQAFAKRLMQYDVISFDVFDTLVLRPFSSPTDLFYIVGMKLNYLDFERIRREMEWSARQKAKETNHKSYEITLSQIYEELEEMAGIPREKGIQFEIDTELSYCFGNPYMLEVFACLADSGKTIVCTSDMYLPKETIKAIVEKCGYKGISEYFISCEYQASKGDGKLFAIVKDAYGADKKYVHVGDNRISDVEIAKKCGFVPEYYRNVNLAGKPYRAEDMSVVTGSVYRGIVNSHIHNGLNSFSKAYEVGFIYGGLFVLGYCKWIHRYVTNHNIDKILFLSRDGDVLNQVYNILYPKECEMGKAEYVYWSRLAATKMAAGYYKYDYFRRFIDHKINQGISLKKVFEGMEIQDMLEDFLTDTGLYEDVALTSNNANQVKTFLRANWSAVLSHYEEQLKAGKEYFTKVLQGCKKVAAVDIGWAGSGAITLNYIVNDIWKLDCEVVGLLSGTNSVHNSEQNMSEGHISYGKVVSYMFSQEHNRDLWKWHDAAKGHNLGVEYICSSSQGSLKGFYENYISQKPPELDVHTVEEICQGIKDFVEEALKTPLKEVSISGNDAYRVLYLLLKSKKNIDEMTEKIEVGI